MENAPQGCHLDLGPKIVRRVPSPRCRSQQACDPRPCMVKQPGHVRGRGRRAVTTIAVRAHALTRRQHRSTGWFVGQIAVWLWFTVLFANFAEAMAEGRGKAQADTLRKTQTDDHGQAARQRRRTGAVRAGGCHRAAQGRPGAGRGRRHHPRRRRRDRGRGLGRRVGHHRRVGAGDPRERRRPLAPSPAARECSPTGSWCRSPPTRRDLPGPHDRPGRGGQAAEDAQRDRPEDPAGRPDHHLPAGRGHPRAVRHLLRAGRSR